MKNIYKIILAMIISLIVVSFTIDEIKKSSAEVKQIQGIYIFFCAEPVRENEYLGTVKVGATWDSSTESRLNAIIKNCKKQFPQAEAVVFKNIDYGSADAIRFK